MKKKFLYLAILFTPFNIAAQNMNSDSSKVATLITNVKEKYVPDTREAVYNISSQLKNDTIFLKGSTSSAEALKDINNALKDINSTVVHNGLKLLPDAALGDTLYGVINVSVADIRTQNRFTSGMATQSLLGTPIKLLEKDGWYRIQMPDTYIGWAHEKQIVTMNKKEYNAWIMAPKIIFTNHYGFAYTEPNKEGPTVADLVAGNILNFMGIEGDYFKVMYPDKRVAYVLRKESQEYSIWLQSHKPSAESFLEKAKTMMGLPYVWGGVSTKGVDCSGLISTVMTLHGLTILRDASQQANVGIEIDITEGYDNLQPGDLMFFGKSNSIRHVGFYLGDNKFLHASGCTRINSLDPRDADYDELNTKEFVKATRIITGNELHGVKKVKNNSFYHLQK